MPIIKSAKKRVRTAKKAAIRNAKTKRLLKSAIKLFTKKAALKSHSSAQSALDKAVKKGIVHKNKAARIKKRLAAQAKVAGVKPASATSPKKAAPKAAPKKSTPAPKKAAAKKTSAKTVAKKSATKK
jgi:small subunit ribosomal protein S20